MQKEEYIQHLLIVHYGAPYLCHFVRYYMLQSLLLSYM